MTVTKEQILDALGRVPYPGFTRDIVSAGVVADLVVQEGRVAVRLQLGADRPEVAAQIERAAREALLALDGVREVEVGSSAASGGAASLPMAGTRPSAARGGAVDAGLIPGVRHPLAVASGKGGVGKSTVAVNLAVALARQGASVGLLDADVYGPSVPLMMGLASERPRLDAEGRRLVPFERYGVRFMSLGFLVEQETAVIWRGPMVMKALEQLLRDVAWGTLDVLVVDMPPGTGDAQLTMSQRVQLSGAVIVTTPQDVALADAVKGVSMFRKVGVDVLGLVENMSYFVCPHCDQRSDVFRHGGGRKQAERMGIPFLGEVPLDPAIVRSGDDGRPIVDAEPEGTQGQAFARIAAAVRATLD